MRRRERKIGETWERTGQLRLFTPVIPALERLSREAEAGKPGECS